MFEDLKKGLYQTFILDDNYQYFIKGIQTTLIVTVFALILGVILGVIIAIIRSAHDQQPERKKNIFLRIANLICQIYLTVIRGTPMMVQLLIMWFVVWASARATDGNMIRCAILAFGINSGAYVAEIIRSGIMSIDKGQMEASRALGLNWFQAMRFVIMPQAFKRIIPPLGNEFIAMLKDSSLVSVIGFEELTRTGQLIISRTYAAFEIWIVVALLYLIMTLAISRFVALLEKRFSKGTRK